MRFARTRQGVVKADVRAVEASVLTSAVSQLQQLLGEAGAVDADPLAAMVGLPPGEVRRPDDPALSRLLPDAYRASQDPDFDVEQAAGEFRRYTEGDLRAGKRAQAAAVLAHLSALPAGGRLRLDRAGADAWLGTLNDLRLVLGTRLEVTEETGGQPPPDDEDRAHALQVYAWLGWLQESLLDCLDPTPGR